ncbi:MAG: polysaccharide biosynthesis protein [Candidatus Kaiserbacteria bacterium]|nr:polysaccharide biosynthesis protein [Candidatus Kaiserbacteria bacterium]
MWPQLYNRIERFKLVSGAYNLKSFAKDASWTTVSSVIITASNFALVYILANLMSPNEYGQFKLIGTWLAIAIGFGFSGYNYMIPQQIARNQYVDLNRAIRYTFVKSIPAAIALFCFALYYLAAANIHLGFGFVLAASTIPFVCAAAIINSYYLGKRDFPRMAITQNSVDIFQIACVAAVAYISGNFLLIISIFFIATIIGNIAIILYTLKRHVISGLPSNSSLEDVQQKNAAKKINIASIVLGFTTQADKLLIFHFMGGVELAIYSIVTAISDQARVPTKIFGAVLLPRMASDNTSFKRMLFIFVALMIFCAFLSVCLLFIYPILFEYVFPKYIDSVYLADVSTLTVLFAPVSFLTNYVQSKNDLKTLTQFAYLNSFLQIIFYSIAAYLGSIVLFLIFRALLSLINSVLLLFRLSKNTNLSSS